MRTLLVAAAVILSAFAASAQEMVPANSAGPVAQNSNDRALPAQPSPGIIEQLKAAGELKDDPKRLEAPAPKLADDAKPADTTPAQAAAPVQPKPAEAPPVVAKPAEVKPAETTPAAPKVVDTKSTEPKAVETKPVETKPAQAAATTKPAKKKVVRKRETDEQKARRIAAKYGISW